MYTQAASRRTEQHPARQQGYSLTPPNQPRPVASRERLSIVAHDMRNYLTPMRMRVCPLLRRAVKEDRQTDARDRYRTCID